MNHARSSRARWIAVVVSAVLMPACGSTGSPGGSNPNGILWNSQGSSNPPQNGQPTPGWIDPNQGVVGPIGISNIIVSTDDATYDGFFPSGGGLSGNGPANVGKIQYIPGLFHPLSTDTGSVAITSRESLLEGDINAYRQTKLGNIGGGGLGGGIIVGTTSGIILAGHFEATKSARAHCNHYAKYHGGFPPGQNFEGDDLLVTAPGTPAFTPGTPQLEPGIGPPFVAELGRLGKLDVVANAGASIAISGAGYDEADPVETFLVTNVPNVLLDMTWTNLAVGHWRGGPDLFYWNIIFLSDPTPAN
ncbi:MAG TPA: hypothetical protein VMU54_00395 [Planctomycetota bacterium]|nr:hypothetical protein [Planctomycetota bacterium]